MEDSPKVNKMAIASALLGLVAATLISVGTILHFAERPGALLCPPAIPFGLLATMMGVEANRQIKKSEGSQRGSVIAWGGLALGAFSFTMFFVVYIVFVFTGRAL